MITDTTLPAAVAVLVAAIGIISSIIASVISLYIERRKKDKIRVISSTRASRGNSQVQEDHIGGISLIEEEILIEDNDSHLTRRLSEAKFRLQQFDRQIFLNSLANGFLIFGQTIIGGILTTSFIQESLSKQSVGILGLLVLLATLVHQSYRPDLKSKIATSKSQHLRRSIRDSEDSLVRYGNDKISDIIEEVTKALNKVDAEEEWEIVADKQKKKQLNQT